MFLKYRPIRLDDFSEGLLCIRDQFAFDDATRPRLLEMWRELVVSGAGNATLIEDLDRPPGHRFLQYCIIAFISPEFAASLKADAPPLIAPLMLREWQAGRRPWLSLDQVRRANSRGGVTWAVVHSGPRPELMHSPEAPVIGAKITDYTPWAIAGYRLNEIFLETYSPLEYAYAEEYGMGLCRERLIEVPGQAGVCVRLYHLTHEQAAQRVGSASGILFHHQPPRFGLSLGEQHLLWCGLYGETDEELADQLGLALVTVKKRWRGVYEKVAAASPALLGPPHDDARRGSEKRRRLLAYLRHHMEELRPVERPRTGK